MTESEAIEELKCDCNELGKAIPCDTSWGMVMNEAYGMAVKALEEIQQYRLIGTVSKCREAMEKQKAKKSVQGKPFNWIDSVKVRGKYKEVRRTSYGHACSSCGERVAELSGEYCSKCGQAISWKRDNE